MSDCRHCAGRERSEFCWWLKEERKKEARRKRADTKPRIGRLTFRKKVVPVWSTEKSERASEGLALSRC